MLRQRGVTSGNDRAGATAALRPCSKYPVSYSSHEAAAAQHHMAAIWFTVVDNPTPDQNWGGMRMRMTVVNIVGLFILSRLLNDSTLFIFAADGGHGHARPPVRRV